VLINCAESRTSSVTWIERSARLTSTCRGTAFTLSGGDLKGMWSITISGNWRIVFRFADGDAFDVDLMDYH
jgi:plasmid maintenance system killer protein